VLFDGDVLEHYRCFHIGEKYANKGVVGVYGSGKVVSLWRLRSRCRRRSCGLVWRV
jgi:hypothetical protein